MYFLLGVGSRVFAKGARILREAAMRYAPDDLQRRKVIASTHYDMAAGGNESYYSDQYWNVIRPHLDTAPPNATVLDLGCGQGRLSIRMARHFPKGRVLGCDISESAIEKAREYAGGQSNVDYKVLGIEKFLDSLQDRSADVVIMTEVTFFFPEWRDCMPHIKRCLKPGGILIMSFRSQYFYALATARSRSWDDVQTIVSDRSGRVGGGMTRFTWQTSGEVRDFLLREHGFEVVDLAGVGACSGIAGDPHDSICQPGELQDAERLALMTLENALSRSVPDGGRYILAVARKPMDA